MNFFGKMSEDTELVATKRRRNSLVSEPNYHTTNFFTKNLLVIEIKENSVC